MSGRSASEARPPERSPWSRPSVLISGACVLLLVLLGVIVAVTGSGAGKPSPSPAGAAPATATGTHHVAASSTACTLPAGRRVIPSASPPAGATWHQVGSMQAPQAPLTLGPERTHSVWNTCFAHGPSGALLAAFNLWAEGTAAPSGQVYRHLAVDVPAQAYRTATRLDDQGPVQFAGYRYDSYTPARAQVAVVLRGPEGKLLAVVTPMIWSGGDWKYVFPATGTPAMQVIPDLTGYVPWSSF